jgi:pimeloyl-ACP methyl ester carboxylesterase
LRKTLRIITVVIVALALIYFVGPTPSTPSYSYDLPKVPSDLTSLEKFISEKEAAVKLRENNEAQIVWANDTLRTPTEYVFLYIHGFSASQMEGNPVHRNIAKRFESNLYLARITGQGQDTIDAMWNYTPENAWNSAKEALAIAKKLGKKIIILSTSTGGTLALKLSAEYPDKVFALINLSPNIRIKDPLARIMNDPWGLQILRIVYGGNYRTIKHPQPKAPLYWDTIYRVEALVALEELMETTMTQDVFSRIVCPVLTLYYYKDEENQDQVVDVSVIPDVHKQLSTPNEFNIYKALTTPGNHVIGSSIKSDDYLVVQNEIISFCENILKINPSQNKSGINTTTE